MAVSGGFGLPDRTDTVRASLPARAYPPVYLLSVFVGSGNFMRLEPIGVGSTEAEVASYFDQWVSIPENRARYAGRKQVVRVPYVGQL